MGHTKWAVGFKDQGLGHGIYGVVEIESEKVIVEDVTKKQADEIIKRWNRHDGLVEALKQVLLRGKGLDGPVERDKPTLRTMIEQAMP